MSDEPHSDSERIEARLHQALRPAANADAVWTRLQETTNYPVVGVSNAKAPNRIGLLDAIAATAAAVLIGVLSYQLRDKQAPVPAQGVTEKTVSNDGELPAAKSAEPELSDAEKKQVAELIARLDADAFDDREAAKSKLEALGPKIRGYLRRLLQQGTLGENVSDDLQEVMANMLKERRSSEDILREIDRAVEEAPKYYLPADPDMVNTLKSVQIIFDENIDLPGLLNRLERKTGVRFVFDSTVDIGPGRQLHQRPASAQNISAFAALHTIFNWGTNGQPDVEATYVLRGKMVLITTVARAEKLLLEDRTIVLPELSNRRKWTLDETRAIAGILQSWPVIRRPRGSELQWAYPALAKIAEFKPLQPGILFLRGEDWVLNNINEFLRSVFSPATPEIQAKPEEWEIKVEALLDQRASVNIPKANFRQILAGLSAQLAVPIGCYENGPDNFSDSIVAQDKPAREILLEFCRKHKFAVFPDSKPFRQENAGFSLNTNEYNVFTRIVGERFVFDITAAVQKGAHEKDLITALTRIVDEGRMFIEDIPDEGDRLRRYPHMFVMNNFFHARSGCCHGRFFGQADIYTQRRLSAVIKAAENTGKIIPAPPRPWFFELLPLEINREK
jgi:hypothetical protein